MLARILILAMIGNTRDLGGYFLIEVDTGKNIFYRGEIKPINVKFLVLK